MKKMCRTIMITMMVTMTSSARAQDVSFDALLNEMIDRTAIARFPDPMFTCKQMSSYDRAMKTPEDETGWFSNSDNNQFLRTGERDGRKEDVMFDAEGPGAVVRIWITTAGTTGNLRLYVDDMETPIVVGTVEQLMGGEYGKSNQVPESLPWIAERSRGRNCYFPIPYADRCKITFERTEGNGAFYYQVNYRTYTADTKVESISAEIFSDAKSKIAEVGSRLFRSGIGPYQKCSDNDFQGIELTPVSADNVDENTTSGITVKHKYGPEAIRMLRVKLQADDPELALRQTVLRIQFDDEVTVEVPVGDFFGSGVGVNPYSTWWNTVESDGTMTCYWPMPYKKTCHLELLYYGEQKVTADLHTEIGKWTDDDRFMYFHATRNLVPEIDSTEKRDMNYLMAKGSGVYAGDVIMIANPTEAWWGEGDEKVYIDGESFPSHIGTGTEDYYGYAWCCPEYFTDPFHAQPRCDGPGNQGHTTNTRIRILDGIPFEKSLRFDMELWHWDQVQTGWATVSYWYAKPGATSNHPFDPETLIVHMPKGREPMRVEGAIEGESMKICDKTGDGVTETQSGRNFRWSGDSQLWWKNGKTGDVLTLDFDVGKTDVYDMELMLTRAVDYGIVQLSLDGERCGEPIDLYETGGVFNRAVTFGNLNLGEGTHTLTIEITGKNDSAIPSYMFGLDYLLLRPVK
ncbi:MAG: DUF2961 domain-containing protein [Planctomycetia bacterium]|nr:DUF2961 domain-containing protein [Planctomycetia bacterium]